MAGGDLREAVGLVHSGCRVVRRYEGSRKYRREEVQKRLWGKVDYKSLLNTKMPGQRTLYVGVVSFRTPVGQMRADKGRAYMQSRSLEATVLMPHFISMYLHVLLPTFTWI